MKQIINDVVEHGINSSTLDAYLTELGSALSSAVTAAENGQSLTAMAMVGEAKVHYDHAKAIWDKFNEQTPKLSNNN